MAAPTTRWGRALEGLAFVALVAIPGVGWLVAALIAREMILAPEPALEPDAGTGDTTGDTIGATTGATIGATIGDTIGDSNGRVDAADAPAGRRIAAGAIDAGLAYALYLVPSVGFLAAVAFMGMRDHAMLGGKSPGKRATGLAVVGARTTADHVRRNFLVALPGVQIVFGVVALVTVLRGGTRRLGDRWAGTRVVVGRD